MQALLSAPNMHKLLILELRMLALSLAPATSLYKLNECAYTCCSAKKHLHTIPCLLWIALTSGLHTLAKGYPPNLSADDNHVHTDFGGWYMGCGGCSVQHK